MTTPSPDTGNFAAQQLRAFVERIENAEEEIKERNSDKRDIYAEAKANGYDVKALKTVVALRRKDASERAEEQAILSTYLHALGMSIDSPKARPEPETDSSDQERWEERAVA